MKKGKLYIVIRPIEDGEGTYVSGPAADQSEAAKWYRKLVKHEEFDADAEVATIEFLTKNEVKALEAADQSAIDEVLNAYVEEDTDDEDEDEEQEQELDEEDEDEEPEPEPVPVVAKPTPRRRPAAKPAARPRRRSAKK